ncbi:MAG: tRNA methyltransferase [Candidatus Poribacteria bacterium]|nr:tRNA methyltransferase [Candidatus Poribacteria bacterium]
MTERDQLRGTELKRFWRAIDKPNVDLTFLLHSVQDPINVGTAFRLADACGVRKIYLSGITIQPPHSLLSKVARYKDKSVQWRYFNNGENAVEFLKREGYTTFALEITGDAVAYDEIEYPPRVAIVVGHEEHGIPKRVLGLIDHALYVPMYGKGASLNVSQSLGIASYHLIHSRKGQAET